jgi:hypothetical protein
MIQLSARAARWGLIVGAVATAATAGALIGASTPPVLAASSGPLQTVNYLGYNFAVPASWSVIHTTPTTCVRFDRHAIYLGTPGPNQNCPTGLLGTTEAIEVQPQTGHVSGASAAEDEAADRITVVTPTIEVTATYDTDRALVTQILASASLPLPSASAPAENTADRAAAKAARQLATPAAAAATVPASTTSFVGEGFDACTAPSAAFMSAWKGASPYGAVGIYIGGAERACAQPNLTAAWVAQQAAAGWHFIPTYVGVQAEFDQITSPASQAVAAAEDAVTQAAALGFGPGTPIYYDMEAYPAGQESNALAFMSAWTTQLHAEGYKSAIYSSSSSGVTDLVDNFTKTKYAMPDVIWDALWNGEANTTDPAIPAGDWANNDRAHQFNGGANETYGGDTIDVDQDYLDVALTPPGPVDPGQPALVATNGAVADYVIRSKNLYTYYQTSPGGAFTGPKKLTTAGGLTGTPVAVQAADGLISVYAETTKGAVQAFRQSAPGAAVSKPTNLAGRLEGSPAAIATQRGTVAVYAVGVNGDLYTYYQTSAGGGYTGPKQLTTGRNLTGSPAVVQAANGILSVYTRTTSGAVKAVWQNAIGRAVTKSRNLGGHLAGNPAAIVTARDTIAVYAIGTNKRLYGYQQSRPGASFTGPTKLTSNGGLAGTPVAIPAANGTVSVYARTIGGVVRTKSQSVPGGKFNGSGTLGGHIASDLAGVVNSAGAALYATGTNGHQYGDQDASGSPFAGWKVL